MSWHSCPGGPAFCARACVLVLDVQTDLFLFNPTTTRSVTLIGYAHRVSGHAMVAVVGRKCLQTDTLQVKTTTKTMSQSGLSLTRDDAHPYSVVLLAAHFGNDGFASHERADKKPAEKPGKVATASDREQGSKYFFLCGLSRGRKHQPCRGGVAQEATGAIYDRGGCCCCSHFPYRVITIPCRCTYIYI